MAPSASANRSCATSTPAAPMVATPAAPAPLSVRLSASASRGFYSKSDWTPRKQLARRAHRAKVDVQEA